jgi:hypothetical protein
MCRTYRYARTRYETQYCKCIHACLTEICIYCNTVFATLDSKLLTLYIHFNYICDMFIHVCITVSK